MLHRTLTALILSATTLFGSLASGKEEPAVQSTTTTIAIAHKTAVMDVHEMMLHQQIRTRKVASVKFWEAVSWCEVNHNWKDRGYFSGGLGMAQSVWESYGGREFASKPYKASKTQQIIVANRVAFLGFQTRHTYRTLDDKLNDKPYFRPAVGWRNLKNWGRNCVNWRTRKPLDLSFTEQG